MSKKKFAAPEYFINRELSWLEFNDRVLCEGLNERLPLMERLKFLAIVSSNLDEFFMIRVAGLTQKRDAGVRKRDPSGMTPNQQLNAIAKRAGRMIAQQSEGIESVLAALREHGLKVCAPAEWTPVQRQFLRTYFSMQVLPVLTPMAVEALEPSPLLAERRLLIAALVDEPTDEPPRVTVVNVPGQFSRFVPIPGDGETHVARIEDVIRAFLDQLFPEPAVLCSAVLRVTRDADVALADESDDLLSSVEQAVITRRRRAAVRLEISCDADSRLRTWAVAHLGLRPEQVYPIRGMIDATALFELVGRQGFDDLRIPDWPAQPVRDLAESEDLWETLRSEDVLLFHPYETFDPVVQLIDQAADDPDVLAIKQTLYRTSGDSPIIAALERAAQNGKEVTVLVELKARFDESRNVNWARRLEDAGCQVIYGIANYKTHAKALLIIRREADRIRRYVHLATGNYNDKTAKLYSDIGLMTTDRALATDVANFFNLLTGYSEVVDWNRLAIAPTSMRDRFLELIDREGQVSTVDKPGLIMAKVNSLQDPEIIRALYRASGEGVKIMLNVRGICCLRPGVQGVSENIEVTSIIDRCLEHARVFYFRNGGDEEIFMGSADWMTRNLSKRLETLFPVKSPRHIRRLTDALETYFADNVKARRLLPSGEYEPVGGQPPVRAQESLYHDAVEAAAVVARTTMRFRPMHKPGEDL